MSQTIETSRGALASVGCLLVFLTFSLGMTQELHAATLSPSLLPRVEAATFEVVAAKPAHDPLTYAKPLPLDLIPYQKRTDKYYSIGTAFAIGPNRYVTAGHVLLTGLNSLWGPPELRDDKGRVYAIGNVEKFSLRKDFVVFSLAKPPANQKILPVNTHPTLNQAVYAVGNALGTGVVIRSGLYTSNTPEDQSGAWKWMRFSAAVSPGNSGGPLLDKNGNVIGLVLMKSPVENLNYALPIGEVLNAPMHEAIINRRSVSKFPLINITHTGTFKAQFELPKSLADFNATFLILGHKYETEELKALLTQEPDKMFPNGSGSNRVLHSLASLDSMPVLLKRNDDDTWVPTSYSAGKIPLKDNGYVQFRSAGGGAIIFHLRKPDSISAAKLYSQPKVFMDLLLKTGYMHRPVGSDRIKVTSLGKPLQVGSYTDHWQRRWQESFWPIPFINSKLIMFALPVPDGYAGIIQFTLAVAQYPYQIKLEAALNFLDVAYDGTLAQWKDYLKQKTLLPAALKHININAVYNKDFRYTSPLMSFSFTPAVQKITPESDLTLGWDFFFSRGKVVWGVNNIYISPDITNNNNWVSIQHHVKPSPDLSNNFKSQWNKIVHREHPFDSIAYTDDDVTKISGVAPSDEKQSSLLYTVFYAREGTQPQKLMKSRLDMLMEHLRVSEYAVSVSVGSETPTN